MLRRLTFEKHVKRWRRKPRVATRVHRPMLGVWQPRAGEDPPRPRGSRAENAGRLRQVGSPAVRPALCSALVKMQRLERGHRVPLVLCKPAQCPADAGRAAVLERSPGRCGVGGRGGELPGTGAPRRPCNAATWR